jgi:hypothetical protein
MPLLAKFQFRLTTNLLHCKLDGNMSEEKLPNPHFPPPNANGLIAHPYSKVGGGGPGVARRQGSIGIGGHT